MNNLNFKLEDLKSRLKNCIFAEIQEPDDNLIKALITKNLADYQITLDAKLQHAGLENFKCLKKK